MDRTTTSIGNQNTIYDQQAIKLSSVTILGRGWDQKISDEQNPIWNRIYQAIRTGKRIRSGKGFYLIIMLGRDEVRTLKKDLLDHVEIYSSQNDPDCSAWARSFKKDAERIWI